MKEDFAEQYCYPTVEDYERLAGYKVNEAFKMAWNIARVKNKHLGITEEQKEEK